MAETIANSRVKEMSGHTGQVGSLSRTFAVKGDEGCRKEGSLCVCVCVCVRTCMHVCACAYV